MNVLIDTADVFIFDENGKKITEMKKTKSVAVELTGDSLGKITIKDIEFNKTLLEVIGEKNEKTDFDKELNKSQKISFGSLKETMKKEFKIIAKTVTRNAENSLKSNDITIIAHKAFFIGCSAIDMVSGELSVTEYTFKAEKDDNGNFIEIETTSL